MVRSREDLFEELLSALGSSDPLESILARAARLCGGSALVVNELGEVIRSIGPAPSQLIAGWVLTSVLSGSDDGQPTDGESLRRGQGGLGAGHRLGAEIHQEWIGRWQVRARTVPIRQRGHALVIAVRDGAESGAETSSALGPEVPLILDLMAKLLLAFEGFERFSISTRMEESSRLMRDLEAGVSPGRESALWRLLENFGFEPYAPVRIVRAQLRPGTSRQVGARPGFDRGIVIRDSGRTTSTIEHTALCRRDFAIADFLTGVEIIGIGVSEPFTALAQVPEMLVTADVALAAAPPGETVSVDEMRPVEWAAARMSSRFDKKMSQRFLDRLSGGEDTWLTLQTYLDCGSSIPETARRLQVHQNTVRYRLGHVERALGARLGDARVAADVVLALECRRMRESRP